MSTSLHCITCSEPLLADAGTDVFVTWYRCANDHRFFRVRRESRGEDLKRAAAIDPFPAPPTPEEAAERWLRDPDARKHLNPQLALALARFDSGPGRDVPPFGIAGFCPNCGAPVRGLVHGDPTLRGLVCEEGHEAADRQGRIWVKADGETLVLARELPDEAWPAVLDGWLAGGPTFQEQLPDSVRVVLAALRERLGQHP